MICSKTLVLLYSERFEVFVGVLGHRYAQQGDAIIRSDKSNEGGSDVYDIVVYNWEVSKTIYNLRESAIEKTDISIDHIILKYNNMSKDYLIVGFPRS
jgi:hypothetical protein